MKRGTLALIFVGAGLLLLAGGGAAVAIVMGRKAKERLALLMPHFKRESDATGVPVSWLLGIAGWETRGGFNPLLVAGKGTADEVRGGSFGTMQMSMATARGLGYDGPDLSLDNVEGTQWQGEVPRGSLLDPSVNIHFGALYIAQLRRRFGNFADVAAAYNSGKPVSIAPKKTREEYVPGALAQQKAFAMLDSGGSLT